MVAASTQGGGTSRGPDSADRAKATSLIERKFMRLGLHAPGDFIVHLPLRYEDETHISTILSLYPGCTAQVEGEVLRSDIQYRPRRQLHAVIEDSTGQL